MKNLKTHNLINSHVYFRLNVHKNSNYITAPGLSLATKNNRQLGSCTHPGNFEKKNYHMEKLTQFREVNLIIKPILEIQICIHQLGQ